MSDQDKPKGLKLHFRRAKAIALSLSLVLASNILFLIYEYDGKVYQHIPFWELRWLIFGLIFLVAFIVIWRRSGRQS